MLTDEQKKRIESLTTDEMTYEINLGRLSRFQREKFAYLQTCHQLRVADNDLSKIPDIPPSPVVDNESSHDEVAKVVKIQNEQKGGVSKWSDTKKYVMGIVGFVILGILGWVGNQISSELEEDRVSRIKQVQPIDGASFDYFPRTLTLEWGKLSDTSRYIIELEIQSDGKWYPHPGLGRFVTTDTTQSLEFIGAQPGRWKVVSVNANEETIGESPWWYFSFTK